MKNILSTKYQNDNIKNYFIKKWAIYMVIHNDFWFIDIPRTSSSSLKIEISKKYGFPFGKENLMEKDFIRDSFFLDHIPALQLRDELSVEIFNNLFTFTIIRNPFDRILSMYLYRLKIKGLSNKVHFNDYVIDLYKHHIGKKSEFIKYNVHYYSILDYITDESGHIIVKYIGRFENRSKDIIPIAEKLKLKGLGNLKLQSSNPHNYKTFYNSESRRMIEQIYKKDLEKFGYSY